MRFFGFFPIPCFLCELGWFFGLGCFLGCVGMGTAVFLLLDYVGWDGIGWGDMLNCRCLWMLLYILFFFRYGIWTL